MSSRSPFFTATSTGPPPLPTDGIAAAVLEELATDQDNWDEWDGGKDQEGEEGEQDPGVIWNFSWM